MGRGSFSVALAALARRGSDGARFVSRPGSAPASPTPRGSRLRWDLGAEQIRSAAAQLITRTRQVYDAVGALERREVSYQNTLRALAAAELDYTGEGGEPRGRGTQVGSGC